MTRAVLLVALLVLAPLAVLGQEEPRSGDRSSSFAARESERDVRGDLMDVFKDRLTGAIEIVEDACAADINDFCGKVTSGEGRVALCVLAHEDQLSRRCHSALSRVSRNIERSVSHIAGACWSEVQAHCGATDRIEQCVAQKRDSFSPPCQSVVAALGQKVQGSTVLVGMPVYSSDDKGLGRVVEVVKAADGKVQSIQVDIGRSLGIGNKVVAVSADKFEPRIKVMLSDAEVRALPEAKKQ